MKNRILSFMIAFSVLLCSWAVPCFAASDDDPQLQGTAALLMDADTGKILYDKRSKAEMYPASLTKILTAIVVLEKFDLSHKVKVDPAAEFPQGNNVGIKGGEIMTIEELLNLMMIYSANDAAAALAIETSGSVESFSREMNKKAKQIGCVHTNYINPNGFTNETVHHTTARDLAKMTIYAMKKKEFAKIVKKKQYSMRKTNKNKARTVKTTNKLLADGKLHYDGVIGVKTGFMALSGYCFVGEAKKDGMTLIGISLNSPEEDGRFTDVAELFDYGFENYQHVKLMSKGEDTGTIKVKYGHNTFVDTNVPDGVFITMPKSGDENLTECKAVLKDHVSAPIRKGTKVGVVNIFEDGKKVGQSDIVISKTVKKGGPWTKYYISDMAFYIAAGVLILLILFVIVIKVRKRNARRRREEMRKRQRQRRAMEIAAERMDKERRGWPY